jgi:hypothetical protein
MIKDADQRVQGIRAQLGRVDAIRMQQGADPSLHLRVQALKRYQQQRFRDTYGDLLAIPRYERAALFFLEELYGPDDFSTRDAQFSRVVPSLVRLFPAAVVDTVELLTSLHGLTESLDDAMARSLTSTTTTMTDYVSAWQCIGQLDSRVQQLGMVLELGRRLDQLTQNRLLRQSLRWMRPAARTAGLEHLQQFLERGFDGFAGMQGADDFLAIIAQREREFIASMQNPL